MGLAKFHPAMGEKENSHYITSMVMVGKANKSVFWLLLIIQRLQNGDIGDGDDALIVLWELA